jgi:hypothetical protein
VRSGRIAADVGLTGERDTQGIQGVGAVLVATVDENPPQVET